MSGKMSKEERKRLEFERNTRMVAGMFDGLRALGVQVPDMSGEMRRDAEMAALQAQAEALYGNRQLRFLSPTENFGLWDPHQRFGPGVVLGLAAFPMAKEVERQKRGLFRTRLVREVVSEDVAAPLRYRGEQHVLTIAPTRSGKGTCSIIPTLLHDPHSMVVIDPKGQNAAVTAGWRARTFGPVFCINPYGMHAGPPWNLPQHGYNPLAEIDTASPTLLADVGQLASALIVRDGHESSHWTDSARDLITGILLYVLLADEEAPSRTLGRMRQILTASPENFQRHLVLMLEHPHPAIRARLGRYLGEGSDEVMSVFGTAIAQTAFLDDPAISAALNRSDFSLRDLKRQRMTVFIVPPSKYLGSADTARFLRLVTASFLGGMLHDGEGPQGPVRFVLDEFAALGRLDVVDSALGYAAGHGVQLWPIVQDLNQLQKLYPNSWQGFFGNAGCVQVMRANDMATARYFSELAGKRGVVVPSMNANQHPQQGQQIGFSSGVAAVDAVSPDMFMTLRPELSFVFLAGCKDVLAVTRLPYFRWPDTVGGAAIPAAGMWDPDPYHMPKGASGVAG